MVTKKDLVIAVLATFCLNATLFLIIPTSSSSNDGYDPWLDVNDDGKINILDVSAVAKAWQTTGDPTKNVSVTSWPSASYTLINGTLNMTEAAINTPYFYCGGYSRLSLMIRPGSSSIGANNTVIIYLYGLQWQSESKRPNCYVNEYPLSSNVMNTTIFSGGGYIGHGFFITETKGPYFCVLFNQIGTMPANWWITIDYSIYLRNE